jgi:hypothetical protein
MSRLLTIQEVIEVFTRQLLLDEGVRIHDRAV